MCGIIGYNGSAKKSTFLVEALEKLEYRGYDSCGLAVFRQKKIVLQKTKGKIALLKEQVKKHPLEFNVGIAHTRWATHGVPNRANAHPHFDCQREIFLVHNGIIENYQALKKQLVSRHHHFLSATDTEVIAHLFEENKKKHSPQEAFKKTLKQLKGSFALAAIVKGLPQTLFVARQKSPLIIGVLEKGFFVASDLPAILPYTRKVIYLADGQFAVIKPEKLEIFTFSGKKIRPQVRRLKLEATAAQKGKYPHFMLKEIFQQPDILRKITYQYLRSGRIAFPEIHLTNKELRKLKKIYIFACGTAYHAGFYGKYILEKLCGLDVEIDVSSEARYRRIAFKKGDVVLVISQSGETADTLAAARLVKRKGAKVLAVCNVPGSSLSRESDGIIYTLAGPEIGVASTKAYTAQLAVMFLFTLYISRIKNYLASKEIESMLYEFKRISHYQEKTLKDIKHIRKVAYVFSKYGCFLFLGRNIHFPSALEGALKLKEISYVPAEGYAAGEMKHGPIALIDEYRAVICLAPQNGLYKKMVGNMEEVKARKGKIIGIVNTQDKIAAKLCDKQFTVPKLKHAELYPLITALPLQLFAYFVAKKRGCEIDQPRNLAKSVTVE